LDFVARAWRCGEFLSLGAAVDWGAAALRGVLRPKRPAVKTAASWKKFLRELLMKSSERIARVILMFVARDLAMIGLARFLIRKERSAGRWVRDAEENLRGAKQEFRVRNLCWRYEP